MAETIVSTAVQQLGVFLQMEFTNEVIMVVGVKEEIQELEVTLKNIQAVLHDAEKKKVQNESVKVWLEALEEVVYEIEEVLDDWNIKILKSRIKKESLSSSKKVWLYPCFCVKNSILLRHRVGLKAKEIRKSLDSIKRNGDAFHLTSGFEAEISQPREITSSLVNGTSSLVNEPDVFGREGDRDIIVEKILGESGHHGVGVPVISILGGGGLGKTTLAQLVSQDASIKNRFGKPSWVCVSKSFDRTRLAKAIIFEVSGEEVSDKLEWNALHHRLMATLKDKLFLLILDDVWTENFTQWNPFKLCLDGGAAGSRILITTRKVRVTEMVSSIYTHHLQGLNDENSWSLLQFAASIGDETQDYETFEKIGKAIALKCKGVPLSIKTLGSMLRFKKTKHEWERVLKSEMWSLPEFVDTVNPALSLSYSDLQSEWKSCFIYCATFPKDHIIKKDVLIKLWMAHGFLYSSEGRELEDIGEEYFNGIAARSLFQDLDKDGNGDIQSCKMHDLVHDFVHFLSNKKTCIIEGDDVTFNSTKLHHLTVCGDKDITTVPSFGTTKNVRTLNLNNRYSNRCQVGVLKKIFRHWTNLRSLDISHTYLLMLPPEIEKLVHLRYLDLSHTNLQKLPNTLGNLCNLQTFKLNHCYHLIKLPASMGNLINLRHLEIDFTSKLRSLPKGIEKLTSLSSLNKFIVGAGFKLSDLKSVKLIQRSLHISGLGQVKDANEAEEAELGSKQSIRDLILDFKNVSDGDEERMEGVLGALQPPPHLEVFRIWGYPGSQLPCWMDNRSLFLKLRVLVLSFDEENKCTQVPSLGKLPLLENLEIRNMRSLQRLDLFGISENKEDASDPILLFPNLIELTLWDMSNLEKWVLPFERSDIIQIMPCLRKLTISGADKLKALPAVWKLESLQELLIMDLKSVRRLGPEFFGISENDVMGLSKDGKSLPLIIFPKLERLRLLYMNNLEEWELPFERSDIIQIMPSLRSLTIKNAYKLKALPAVWKLESLECLTIGGLSSVTRVGPEFFDISENDVMGLSLPIIIFPKLKMLDIRFLGELEEWEMKMPNWREDITFLMPCLNYLLLQGCPKLKVIPRNLFSYQPVKEEIYVYQSFLLNYPELKLPYEGTNQIIKRKEVGESSGTN